MEKLYFVYIMTNRNNTVLYTGVTNDLSRRVWEHKHKVNIGSFSAKYNVNKLIYCEDYLSINDAISREKQIKGWLRRRKIALIKSVNPKFKEILVI